jgi:pimeloyl-ACP methyl ester carboxylesterase
MKENARLASTHPDKKGGMQLLAAAAQKVMKAAGPQVSKTWELHVVGHSAGSIFAAHALPLLASCGVQFKTLQLMAPAITTDLFHKTIGPAVKAGDCPTPSIYALSDVGERDDDVWAYGKSLLYLVSNSFEGRRDTPIVGMQRYFGGPELADSKHVDPALAALFARKVDGRPALVLAGRAASAEKGEDTGSVSRSESHGGFDNDPDTLNSILFRILGHKPTRAFAVRDLQF